MSGQTVGSSAARAAVWAFVSTAGAKIVTLVGLTLLARILAPREFGLLAFAMVYITYAETIGDLGSGMALVYWPDRRDDAAQVTFIVNVAAGIFWFAVTLALAPFIASFFNSPNGVPIVQALSFSFLIRFLGNTHDALAQKDLRFRARAIPELGLAALKAAISIVLAMRGWGAWSLVWGQLGGILCSTILLWVIVPWRPSLRIPFDLFKPMLRYGRGIIAVNVIGAVMYYVDFAAVGRVLGTTVLGLYQMASKIPETTVVVILWVVSKVLFPAFSRLHSEGKELTRPYLIATRYVAALTLPASIGLFFVARPVVLLFFGPAWAEAAPILSAFAIYVGVRSLDHHSGDVLKATGRAHLLAALSFVKAVLIVIGTIIAVRYGAVAVAGTLAVVYGIGTVVTFVGVSRAVGIPLRSIGQAFLPASKASAAMLVALVLWSRWSATAGPLLSLISGVTLGAVVYLAVLRLSDPELFAWARNSLRTRTATPPEELVPHVP